MNRESEFREWLGREKCLADKPAGDVISRCRRIERDMEVSLARACRSDRSFVQLLHDLKTRVEEYSSGPSRNVYGPLRRAARLYSEFLVGPSEVRSRHMPKT